MTFRSIQIFCIITLAVFASRLSADYTCDIQTNGTQEKEQHCHTNEHTNGQPKETVFK